MENQKNEFLFQISILGGIVITCLILFIFHLKSENKDCDLKCKLLNISGDTVCVNYYNLRFGNATKIYNSIELSDTVGLLKFYDVDGYHYSVLGKKDILMLSRTNADVLAIVIEKN